MRPPKKKWELTGAAAAAISSALAAVAGAVELSPRERDLVAKAQNATAELLEHIDRSEECEMD